MSRKKDSYRTLKKITAESLFKDRGSKFLGQGFPIKTEDEAKSILARSWEAHPKASHICYAWQLGTGYEHYHANDDGEPNNSAGMPIYGQLQSYGLTQALVTVIRYYGGVNLGVGGLIHAYKNAAQQALEMGVLVKKTIKSRLRLHFEYPQMNAVMRIIKEENLSMAHQEMYLDCTIELAIRLGDFERIKARFEVIQKLRVETNQY